MRSFFRKKKSDLLRKIRKTMSKFPTMGRIDLFLYRASTMTICVYVAMTKTIVIIAAMATYDDHGHAIWP